MDLLIIILTIISLILSIISDIIAIQSQKKIEKFNINSEFEITYTTTKAKFSKYKE